MRILIVEDVTMVRKLLQNILAPFGECIIVGNGREALDTYSAARSKNTPFDLICLDIMIPEINGQKVLKSIRDLEKHNGIPDSQKTKIIMISALNESTHVIDALKTGCDGYVTKPFNRNKIIDEVKKLGFSPA